MSGPLRILNISTPTVAPTTLNNSTTISKAQQPDTFTKTPQESPVASQSKGGFLGLTQIINKLKSGAEVSYRSFWHEPVDISYVNKNNKTYESVIGNAISIKNPKDMIAIGNDMKINNKSFDGTVKIDDGKVTYYNSAPVNVVSHNVNNGGGGSGSNWWLWAMLFGSGGSHTTVNNNNYINNPSRGSSSRTSDSEEYEMPYDPIAEIPDTQDPGITYPDISDTEDYGSSNSAYDDISDTQDPGITGYDDWTDSGSDDYDYNPTSDIPDTQDPGITGSSDWNDYDSGSSDSSDYNSGWGSSDDSGWSSSDDSGWSSSDDSGWGSSDDSGWSSSDDSGWGSSSDSGWSSSDDSGWGSSSYDSSDYDSGWSSSDYDSSYDDW